MIYLRRVCGADKRESKEDKRYALYDFAGGEGRQL